MSVTHNVYVDLDSLLDTRVGVFLNAGVTPEELFNNPRNWYWLRLDNDPSIITNNRVSMSDYNKAWAERTTDVLKMSLPTDLLHSLADITRDMTVELKRFNQKAELNITVNTYPYDLSAEELEAIEDAIKFYVDISSHVVVRSIPYSELTTDNMRKNWSKFFMYNFNDWIGVNAGVLTGKRDVDMEVMVPNIAMGKRFELVEENVHGITDRFKALQMIMMDYFKLEFLPIDLFNLPVLTQSALESAAEESVAKSNASKVSMPIRS